MADRYELLHPGGLSSEDTAPAGSALPEIEATLRGLARSTAELLDGLRRAPALGEPLRKIGDLLRVRLPDLETGLGPARARALLDLLGSLGQAFARLQHEATERADRIHAGVGYARQLLDLHLAEAAARSSARGGASLGLVLEDVGAFASRSVGRGGGTFTIRCADPLPRLAVDGPALARALRLLVGGVLDLLREEPGAEPRLELTAGAQGAHAVIELRSNRPSPTAGAASGASALLAEGLRLAESLGAVCELSPPGQGSSFVRLLVALGGGTQ